MDKANICDEIYKKKGLSVKLDKLSQIEIFLLDNYKKYVIFFYNCFIQQIEYFIEY